MYGRQKASEVAILLLTLLAGLILGLIIGSSDFFIQFTLSNLDLFAQWLMATAAVIGVGVYYEQKRTEKKTAGIDLLAFFREKILKRDYELLELRIKHIGVNLVIPRIRFEGTSTLEEVENLDRVNHDAQASIPRKIAASKGGALARVEYIHLQTDLLNMLEELAERIRLMNIVDHDSLYCIRGAFVSILERNTVWILSAKKRTKGTYHALIYLYSQWRDGSERMPTEYEFGD